MARKRPRDLMHSSNPFIHARALAPNEAIYRHEDVARLVGLASGGHNATLYAPRRYGKTSLLKQVLEQAEQRAMTGALIDLSDVLSVADVAARLSQAFRALPGSTRRAIDRELSAISIPTPLGAMGMQRRQPDPIDALHALLEIPAKLAERKGERVVVVLDEFQALTDLAGLDGVFRSHLQHHQQVSYIFTGSEPSLLRSLFEHGARPLFGQAELIRLAPLPLEAAESFIAAKFSETGRDAGDAALELALLAEGHPQRLMLIAHLLWDTAPADRPAGVADLRGAYDAAMRQVDQELRYLWDALTGNERRVLAGVASGLSPYSLTARRLTGLASASSAQRSVDALLGRAVLARDTLTSGAHPSTEDRADLRIVDPLFDRWVRRYGGARASIYVVPRSGSFMVTDGPSLAFERSTHATLEEAEREADRIVASERGAADVLVYDSEDPNDLPDWAL